MGRIEHKEGSYTYQEIEEILIPLLTDEFLEILVFAVHACGWSVDYIESTNFVRWCFDMVDKDFPETNPITYTDKG